MNIEFKLDCIPPKATAQGSSRIMKRKNGQMFVGKSANSNATKAKRMLMALMTPHVPSKPLDGPLMLEVQWGYPWRKSEPRKNRVRGYKHCDTRPDADNLCKMLMDCLGGSGFFNDDGQIAKLNFSKWWCEHPGIWIKIEQL